MQEFIYEETKYIKHQELEDFEDLMMTCSFIPEDIQDEAEFNIIFQYLLNLTQNSPDFLPPYESALSMLRVMEPNKDLRELEVDLEARLIQACERVAEKEDIFSKTVEWGRQENILAVINDRKIYNSTDQNYEPVMISWSDYYAFGMTMPGRNGGMDYRYQFNGMETANEISGSGNSYTTEFRQYDPRLGRWKSLDPLMNKFPHMSPYVGFANNPIYYVDPYGLEPVNGDEGDEGGDDTFPENPTEGQTYEREDGKGGVWSYKYENGVWIGKGGDVTSKDVVVTPGNEKTYTNAREAVRDKRLDQFEFERQYKAYD